MDMPRERSSRLAWPDIAKAISIILLVAWTIIGDRYHVNESLILVRMPLFFFVSGLFASRVITETTLSGFLRDKFANFLYLYALWETILFFSRGGVAHLLWDKEVDPSGLLRMFWDPIFNIWFLYALAFAFLAAWLLRRVPAWIVLLASVALYVASVSDGNWRGMTFYDRLVRLFPFFWLGLMARPLLGGLVERHYRLWPIVLGSFMLIAWFLIESPLNSIGVLTIAVSTVGVAGMLLLSRRIADWDALAKPLTIVGASTLYVYVTHKVFLFYMTHGLSAFGLKVPGRDFLLVAAIIPISVVFGRWAARQPELGWLFAAPWVRRRVPVRAAQPVPGE
jgi:uncharacterized membrane protein YcfT